MRTKLCVMGIFTLGFCFLGCKTPEEKAAEKKFVDGELARMQGKWKIVSWEGAEDGGWEAAGPEERIVIHGDVLQHEIAGEVLSRQKMTILPNTSPVQVDLVSIDDEGKPQTTRKVKKGNDKNKDKVYRRVMKNKAIYTLEGDKLTFHISRDSKKRPADFTPVPHRSLLSLVQMKPGKQEPKEDRSRTDASAQARKDPKAKKEKDR